MASQLIAGHGGAPYTPPKCAIQLAVVSTYLEYMEFLVKKNHKGEDWEAYKLQ